MIALDMKTVMVANIVINVVCLIVMVRLWQLNHNKYPGINFWVADWVLQVSGSVLIALRGTVPNWASMVLSNSMIVGGTLLLYFGLCRFAGKKSARILNYSILFLFIAFILTHIYFTYGYNELLARDYNVSAGLALACILCMWLLFKGVSPDIRPISIGPGIAFGVMFLISLIRIVGFAILPQTGNDYFRSGLFDTSLVLLMVGSIVFIVFSLALLVNRRLYRETQQMQGALQASESKYRDLYENAPVAYFSVGTDDLIKDSNKETQRLFGYSREELVGKPRLDLYAPESKEKAMILFERVKSGGPLENEEMIYQRKDGSKIYGLLSVTPVINETGHLIIMRSVVRNITEQKKAEEKLRETRDYLNNLLDYANAPVIVWDPQFRITRFNHAFENLTGLKSEQVIGQVIDLLFPFEKRQASLEYIRKNTTTGERLEIIEIDIRHMDGSIKTVLWNSANIYAADGKTIIATIAQGQEITKRKKAEKALLLEKNFSDTLFNASQDTIFLFDPATGKPIKWNLCFAEVSGYTDEEIAAMKAPDDFYDADDLKKTNEANTKIVAEGRGKADLLLVTKQRKRIPFEYAVSLVKDMDGRVLFLSVGRNLTERKQNEAKTIELEALKIINLAKSDLLANVSHELRTPLASIKGFIETLMETDVDWNRQQQLEFLQMADKEADHLTLLIKGLLDMSRIDSGKMVLDKHLCTVEEILDIASGELSLVSEKHQLMIAGSGSLPAVLADKIRVAQVIINLVENAAKFSPKGSLIEVEGVLNDSNIIISVEDRGIGMTPDVVAKLFDRFYQAQMVVAGKTKGTGLGLAICKGIVEAHNGMIWVESQPGRGSKFSFSIPLGKIGNQ
jgi:PAS domain S-box-containing protein